MEIDVKKWAKSHKKGIIIAIIFLVIGLIVSPKGVEIKEVVEIEYRNVVKTEYIDECKSFGIYKQIKVVDDEIILTQALGLLLASEMIEATSTFDINRMEKLTKAVLDLAPPLEKLVKRRANLIERLGE